MLNICLVCGQQAIYFIELGEELYSLIICEAKKEDLSLLRIFHIETSLGNE